MAIIPPKRDTGCPDILGALEARFGEVRPASNGWVRIACPTCASDRQSRKFKRYVSLDSGWSNCYICEKPINFCRELTGNTGFEPTTQRAPRIIEEHPMARELPFTAATPLNELPADHRAVKFFHADHLFDLDKYSNEYGIVFVEYADGLDIETSSGYELRVGECLVFPVFFRDELVGWQARFIPGHKHSDRMGKMKYFHIYPKGEYLFNYDKAKEFNYVVLVEGIKKALKLDAAVASLGKGVTAAQIKLLQEWKYVVVMLDGDTKTQEKATKLVADLRLNFVNAVNVNPSDYGCPSPDEMTQEQVQIAVANALQSINYKPTTE